MRPLALAMMVVSAAPAQAQVGVPVNQLPAGTPGCVDDDGTPTPVATTCTWGPVTCAESDFYAGGGDSCAAVAGPVSAACDERRTPGPGTGATVAREECVVSAGGAPVVVRRCVTHSHRDTQTRCRTGAGSLECGTRENTVATTGEDVVECVAGPTPLDCDDYSDPFRDAYSGCALAAGRLSAECAEVYDARTGEWTKGCSAAAGPVEASCTGPGAGLGCTPAVEVAPAPTPTPPSSLPGAPLKTVGETISKLGLR